jgi:hypothetical protein
MDEQAPKQEGPDTPQRRKRTPRLRVLPPAVVPMQPDDYERAVTALAAMIAAWWHDHGLEIDP